MESGQFYQHAKLVMVMIILTIAVMLGSACTAPSAGKQASELQNSGLVIHYMTAPKQMEPLNGEPILCVATDETNSNLSYEWSATGGEIEVQNEQDEIIWTAPDKTGNYTITVVVTNTEGAKATKSTTIVVTKELSRQLAVYSMICQNCKNVIEASRFNEYVIKCDVSNPSGDTLHYTWFATIGKIKGDGPIATWFTGGQYGNVLITVIVTDDKGNKTEGYLAINVSCCH